MKLGIVIPVGPTADLKRWRNTLNSLSVALYPVRYALDVEIIQVVREECRERIKSSTMPIWTIDFPESEFVTVNQQVEVGFRETLLRQCDYVMSFSCNDMICPSAFGDFVEFVKRRPEALIFYGDTIQMSSDLTMNGLFELPDPDKIDWDLIKEKSILPDVAIIRNTALVKFPFDGSLMAGAFRILWMQIWDAFGASAFCHMHRFYLMWVEENGQLTQNREWNEKSGEVFHQWLRDFESKENVEVLENA